MEARHQKRVDQGDAYNPISLSEMESEDEWITEREDPTLPEDTAWMDVSECFEVIEGECSRKKKRGSTFLFVFNLVIPLVYKSYFGIFVLKFVGPRDLNKKGKGKEVVEVEDDEEEEIQVIEEEDIRSEDLLDVDNDIDSDD